MENHAYSRYNENSSITGSGIDITGSGNDVITIQWRWIPISKELPPVGMPCLLYQTYPEGTAFNMRADPLRDHCFIHVGGLRYDLKFVSYRDQYDKEGLKYITHWMELPTKPRD